MDGDASSTPGLDGDDDFTPWTTQGAARLLAAAEVVAQAVRQHAAAITAATSQADIGQVFTASDQLLPALRAYAEAQFDYTGNGYPFGSLGHEGDEPEDDDVDDGDEDAGLPESVISVLRRSDYAVTNTGELLAAGRAAYLDTYPHDDEGAASADVTHLGRALYQIAHARGWDALNDVTGLEAVGATVIVTGQDRPLLGDSEQWPEDLFGLTSGVLYRQDDVYL